MKIAAFLPVTNAVKRGDTFIEAILSHLYWADEVVVVDGDSTDGTVEAIQALPQYEQGKIRIITREWDQENWSWAEFCKAWNYGLENTDADWVAAGESDHIFHQDQAKRLRQEVEREQGKGKAVIKCQKLQSGAVTNWFSKSQMYYIIHKAKYPKIKYGFDPSFKTDLCHPIWHEDAYYEDIPQGEAIIEGSALEGLIGGTGADLYNYLWTFKTLDMVVSERVKANKGWNRFRGFTEVYKQTKPEDEESVRAQVLGQIMAVREKANRIIPISEQPEVMHEAITKRLKPEHIGHQLWQPNN
jgi:glycosyltransferase involved in cell wall biosynthesis